MIQSRLNLLTGLIWVHLFAKKSKLLLRLDTIILYNSVLDDYYLNLDKEKTTSE